MALTEYLWIAVLGGIVGFAYGFLIGANDVANAFASSVSAKSVTLRQAVMIASVCEFSGAFFLGAAVTSTVRSKIFDVDLYENEPEVLMFGMFTSLFTAVIWLFIATFFGLPVSTTHDVVGCIMGFSIAAKGFSSINWNVAVKIFISWFASPLVAGTVAGIFFWLVKRFVMKAEDPFQRAYYTFPIVLTIGIGVDLFYVLFKGVARFDIEDIMSPSWAVPMCFAIGAFFGLLWVFIFGPCAKSRIEAKKANKAALMADAVEKKADVESAPEPKAEMEDEEFNSFEQFLGGEPLAGVGKPIHAKEVVTAQAVATPDEPAGTEVKASLFKKFMNNTVDQDLHAQSMHESARAQEIWDNEEQFDEDAEHLFNFIQVFTASLNSFAHGANDVANTIAPMSAVIGIYMRGEVSSKTGVPAWMLAYGGLAIVVGLLLYGYKVMKSLGYKLTMLSPSRGASAELGASLTVVTASFLGIPVSSTQCIVGAVTAVGLVGGRQAVDWIFLLKICCSWAALFLLAVICSAGFFSFCYYSPGAFYPDYQTEPVD
ncbi:hypothetical protein ACHAW5_009571 [Stephanodiscus triporus]|uniref:Phosphate transporter n=1 Tax=Stephanodiscus triporus TaxID=2934178 RepID=A0ABD3PC09_9STRA